MKEEVIDQKQGNRYDKILKENMDAALPAIMENVLDRENNTFVLHLEWQSQNDKDMVYRMAEYAVMLYRKYSLPVKQYVVFIGKGGIKMIAEINRENLKFKYEIINFKKYDYKIFLNAKDPAIKVFAILANFEKDGGDKAVENIVKEVKRADASGLTGEKHFNQLRILVKLRNAKINLKFKNMLPENFFEKLAEKDTLFKKGRAKGRGEGMEKGIVKGIVKGRVEGRAQHAKEMALLMKNDGSEKEYISKITGVPIDEIEKL